MQSAVSDEIDKNNESINNSLLSLSAEQARKIIAELSRDQQIIIWVFDLRQQLSVSRHISYACAILTNLFGYDENQSKNIMKFWLNKKILKNLDNGHCCIDKNILLLIPEDIRNNGQEISDQYHQQVEDSNKKYFDEYNKEHRIFNADFDTQLKIDKSLQAASDKDEDFSELINIESEGVEIMERVKFVVPSDMVELAELIIAEAKKNPVTDKPGFGLIKKPYEIVQSKIPLTDAGNTYSLASVKVKLNKYFVQSGFMEDAGCINTKEKTKKYYVNVDSVIVADPNLKAFFGHGGNFKDKKSQMPKKLHQEDHRVKPDAVISKQILPYEVEEKLLHLEKRFDEIYNTINELKNDIRISNSVISTFSVHFKNLQYAIESLAGDKIKQTIADIIKILPDEMIGRIITGQ